MKKSFEKIISGYKRFRDKYATGDDSIMRQLAYHGQHPEIMVVACCDSRVDPALLLQCEPGDLFIVRNVANIIPPYEADEAHHGTSAALEFGICYLNVKHLVVLGHSQCGGINALLNQSSLEQNDFIGSWVDVIKQAAETESRISVDDCAKQGLLSSYKNCLTFPWIKERVEANKLQINLWFFDIKTGEISTYDQRKSEFQPLLSTTD